MKYDYDQTIIIANERVRLGDFEQDVYNRGFSDGFGKGQRDIKAIKNLILEAIEKLMNEPQYQHENENWMVGLIMAEDIIEKYMKV